MPRRWHSEKEEISESIALQSLFLLCLIDKVKIPPAVDSAHQVRLKGKGDIGPRNSGKNGTLFLGVTVPPLTLSLPSFIDW